jgi:hypothetical protein
MTRRRKLATDLEMNWIEARRASKSVLIVAIEQPLLARRASIKVLT